jgi:hypothetical protein
LRRHRTIERNPTFLVLRIGRQFRKSLPVRKPPVCRRSTRQKPDQGIDASYLEPITARRPDARLEPGRERLRVAFPVKPKPGGYRPFRSRSGSFRLYGREDLNGLGGGRGRSAPNRHRRSASQGCRATVSWHAAVCCSRTARSLFAAASATTDTRANPTGFSLAQNAKTLFVRQKAGTQKGAM